MSFSKLHPSIAPISTRISSYKESKKKQKKNTFLLILFSNAFDNRLAVAILRIAEGLDCSSSSIGEEEHGALAQSSYDLAGNALMHADSDLSISSGLPRVQSVPSIGEMIYLSIFFFNSETWEMMML